MMNAPLANTMPQVDPIVVTTIDREKLPKPRIRFPESAERLSQFPQYQFFSIAIPYIWGGFRDRVLIDFVSKRNPVPVFSHYKFSQSIFDGLIVGDGNRDWDYVLWAVASEHWNAFAFHMMAAVLSHPYEQFLVRFRLQEMKIPDPLFLRKNRILSTNVPWATVFGFAVATNKYGVAFANHSPSLKPVKVVRQSMDSELRQQARLLYASKDPAITLHKSMNQE